MKIKISILGSTGSVGVSTLKIIDRKKNDFNINLLSANKNFNLICNQIKKYKPNFFLIFNREVFEKVKKKFKKRKVKIINKFDKNSVIKKSDITVSAIPGISGLEPTINMTHLQKNLLNINLVIFG